MKGSCLSRWTEEVEQALLWGTGLGWLWEALPQQGEGRARVSLHRWKQQHSEGWLEAETLWEAEHAPDLGDRHWV